jgi:pilus assembly protein CpaE
MSSGSDKIRVLIVDDILETRENLRKLLYFEHDIEVVGAVASGEEGIAFAKDYQPDIILMDINMPGVDGISASEAISREAPAAQVIMMSVQSEADYLRRSMLAGARDFLTKPFSGDELVTTIRRVHEMGESRRRAMPAMQTMTAGPATVAAPSDQQKGKLVAVFSPKGGTGCTVLAVNLAIAMHRADQSSVVLVDGSLQFGDTAVTLDLRPVHSIYDLMSQIDEMDNNMVESVLTPHSGGIKVLLAPPRPEMADFVTADNLEKVLARLKTLYNYIVVDTWTSLHDSVLTVLDNSDQIVLLTTADIPSLRNVRLFFEVTDQLGYPTEKISLVVNQLDRRKSRIRAKDIEESIKHPVTAELPYDEIVPLSVNQGVPFVVSDGSRSVSQAVTGLADKLIEILATVVDEEEVQPEPQFDDPARSRLGRFFS